MILVFLSNNDEYAAAWTNHRIPERKRMREKDRPEGDEAIWQKRHARKGTERTDKLT